MKPDFQLTGIEYLTYVCPLCYGWRRLDTYLYIGKSVNGIGRPFNSLHHVINKLDKVRGDDFFDFWYPNPCYPYMKNVDLLELYLIEKYKPVYNRGFIPIVPVDRTLNTVSHPHVERMTDHELEEYIRACQADKRDFGK